MKKNKGAFSLFNVVAENFRTNELGLKTPTEKKRYTNENLNHINFDFLDGEQIIKVILENSATASQFVKNLDIFMDVKSHKDHTSKSKNGQKLVNYIDGNNMYNSIQMEKYFNKHKEFHKTDSDHIEANLILQNILHGNNSSPEKFISNVEEFILQNNPHSSNLENYLEENQINLWKFFNDRNKNQTPQTHNYKKEVLKELDFISNETEIHKNKIDHAIERIKELMKDR